MTRRTPQQKKALSLKRDRRNTYGENAKASRKAIPRKKRRQARAERRVVNAAIPKGVTAIDPGRIDAAEARAIRIHLEGGARLKVPDSPLGDVLARNLLRRARVGMVQHATAAKAAHRARGAVRTRRSRGS